MNYTGSVSAHPNASTPMVDGAATGRQDLWLGSNSGLDRLALANEGGVSRWTRDTPSKHHNETGI
jgi:hypothetical protein